VISGQVSRRRQGGSGSPARSVSVAFAGRVRKGLEEAGGSGGLLSVAVLAPVRSGAGGCSLIWLPTARSSDASALPNSASTCAIWSWIWRTSLKAERSVG